MGRQLWWAALLLAMTSSSIAAPVAAQYPTTSVVTDRYETVKVAEGIYAFVAPNAYGTLVSGNSTLIIGDSGALIVDAGHFPRLTRRMIAEVRRLTHQPVRYLVNTHWHPDHWVGNAAYRDTFPGVAIISTEYTRVEMARRGAEYLASYRDSAALVNGAHQLLESVQRPDGTPLSATERAALRSAVADAQAAAPGLRDTRLELPTLTFQSELRVRLGSREVRVQWLGRGNTGGDAIVFVPDARVLVAGDLVVNPTPYAYGSFIGEWSGVLGKLKALDPVAIVPGHGPVERDLSYLTQLTTLLDTVRAQVGAAVARGLTLEQTRKAVHVEQLRRQFVGDDIRLQVLFDLGFMGPGIERAYQEAAIDTEG